MHRQYTNPPRTCALCGEMFTAPFAKSKQVYCSKICSTKASGAAKRRPLEERFWEKVVKAGECWLWSPARKGRGYHSVWLSNGTRTTAHRYSYQLAFGPIPEGLLVCHRCDNPKCVRPNHLFLGTAKDNTQDALAKGRMATGDRNWSRRHPELIRRGEAQNNAKLTADDARAILGQRGQKTQKELAAEYHISPSKVSHIWTGRSWRHVTGLSAPSRPGPRRPPPA